MALSPNLRGIAAIIVATGSFVANDTCMKLALEDAPPFQVLVMRGIAAIIWCLPVIYFMGLIRHLPKAFNPWVVLRSTSELLAILESSGWPRRSEVGSDAAMAAFLVVQHGDLETQKRFLPALRLRVDEGEAQASHWALLLDRVRMREGLPQVYGSQVM